MVLVWWSSPELSLEVGVGLPEDGDVYCWGWNESGQLGCEQVRGALLLLWSTGA